MYVRSVLSGAFASLHFKSKRWREKCEIVRVRMYVITLFRWSRSHAAAQHSTMHNCTYIHISRCGRRGGPEPYLHEHTGMPYIVRAFTGAACKDITTPHVHHHRTFLSSSSYWFFSLGRMSHYILQNIAQKNSNPINKQSNTQRSCIN
jgi:hypothetical protein